MNRLQFDPTGKENMPKVVIRGSFHGDKTFAGLNEYLSEVGRHPVKGNKLKHDTKMICSNAIRRYLKRWKPQNPIILHYRFFEPSKGQRRDYMNIFSFADKCFQDALQDCKVLVDDSPKYVLNTTHDFFYVGKNEMPYIEIYIEEIDE